MCDEVSVSRVSATRHFALTTTPMGGNTIQRGWNPCPPRASCVARIDDKFHGRETTHLVAPTHRRGTVSEQKVLEHELGAPSAQAPRYVVFSSLLQAACCKEILCATRKAKNRRYRTTHDWERHGARLATTSDPAIQPVSAEVTCIVCSFSRDVLPSPGRMPFV